MTDDLMKRLDTLVEDLGEGRACWGHEYISAAVDAMERIEELEAKLAKAVEALRECEEEIDQCVRNEYPHDHPVQERYRQRGFAANPARTTLAELTGGKDD